MKHVNRVTFSVNAEIWEAFKALAPKGEKSRIVNELLAGEVQKIKRERREAKLAQAFQELAEDEGYMGEAGPWTAVGMKGWTDDGERGDLPG